MRISDWSSDVCSSDLVCRQSPRELGSHAKCCPIDVRNQAVFRRGINCRTAALIAVFDPVRRSSNLVGSWPARDGECLVVSLGQADDKRIAAFSRSDEHTSELQSLMRRSYAFFCLKKIP